MANDNLLEQIVEFVITRSDYYKAMLYHPENKLYFLADTEELYRGDVPFSTSIMFYDGDLPSEGAERKLYINNESHEGYVYEDNTWVKILTQYKIVSEITGDPSELEGLVNVTALKKFMDTALSDMKYNEEEHSLDYMQNGKNKQVVIDGLITEAEFDKYEHKIIFKDVNGKPQFNVVIPKDNFPLSGHYDPDTQCIVLVMRSDENDEPYEITIPAQDLVSVEISDVEGNLFKRYDDGGYGVVLDISGKIDKVPEGQDGRILTAKEDGNANAIHMFVGGTHFSLMTLEDGRVQGDPTLLATESGVWHIIKDINENIDKINQYSITQTINKDKPGDKKIASEVAIVNLYKDITTNLDDLTTELDNVKEFVNNNSNSIINHEAQINTILNDISNITNKIDSEILGQLESLDDIKKQIQENSNNISNNSNAISDLNTRVTSNSESIVSIANQLNSLVATHESDVDRIDTDIKDINNQIINLSEIISTLEENLNKEILAVNNKLDEMSETFESFMQDTAFRYYI